MMANMHQQAEVEPADDHKDDDDDDALLNA